MQQAMKKAFIEVRAQVSNLNSFVQERLTGMKIVQLFTREEIESRKMLFEWRCIVEFGA